MPAKKDPVAQMAKLLEYGKECNHHDWYRFFDLWLEAILLNLKLCTPQEWQEFLTYPGYFRLYFVLNRYS
jgi:hypothetical protein